MFQWVTAESPSTPPVQAGGPCVKDRLPVIYDAGARDGGGLDSSALLGSIESGRGQADDIRSSHTR
jgi:hypothetical protein